MWYTRPEWARTCEMCVKYELKGDGTPVMYGHENAKKPVLRQGSPPCWQCPKHPDDTPADKRKPLPMAQDFGPWFWRIIEWYDEGRAVGFSPNLDPLMRQIAGKIRRYEDAQRDRKQVDALMDAVAQLNAKRR